MIRRKSTINQLFLLIFFAAAIQAQEISYEAMKSLDEWRWGVIAYNDGFPGKSLLAMERALSLNPTDPAIKEWLGRAYWKSGMENAALTVWEELIEEGSTSAYIGHRAEQLRNRLSGDNEFPSEDEWIPLATFQGGNELKSLFKLSSSVQSLKDKSGSLVISSYTGGQVVILDANGALRDRFTGGLEGLDRPYDVLPIGDGRLLISEYQADRISLMYTTGLNKGSRVESWGESGVGADQFLGPQYMALSPDGLYVYISDWGNKRVAKWRLDGTHILNIEARSSFAGFQGPSGIVCMEDRVYVADSLAARIDVFDTSGNHLGPLVTEGLKSPEGLTVHGQSILIADGGDIFKVNPVSGELSLETSLSGGSHRITTLSFDDNGNLAVCDFGSNRVTLLTSLSTLYGGLDVTLNRVRADAYPDIFVDFTVQDRFGNPVTGLNAGNFLVFEGDNLVGTPILDWQSFKSSSVSIVAVVDSSGNSKSVDYLLNSIEDMMSSAVTGDEFSLVAAAETPVLHEIPAGSVYEAVFSEIALTSSGARSVPWDEALRLAVNQLAPERKRKSVIAFISNPPAATAFDTYGLVETARIMANNGIIFNAVYESNSVVSWELDYIVKETGGESSFLFQPEGSAAIVKKLRDTGIGRYTVAWKSSQSSGYGRRYLPVSIQVDYIGKSGRGESGMFSPLR